MSLLLRILGATEDEIIRDYLESNSGYQDEARKMAILARTFSLFRLGRRDLYPLLSVKRRYIEHANRVVLSKYGSWDSYMSSGIGVTKSAQSRLRDAFLNEQ